MLHDRALGAAPLGCGSENHPVYEAAEDAAGMRIAISLFADRAQVRAALEEEARMAGFRAVQAEGLDAYKQGEARALGDIVFVDAPVVDATARAMLGWLDGRVARSGAQLIVSTTIGALEPAMAVMRASDPVLLVEPGRAERLVALGEALADVAEARVRDLPEEDRVAVMRLVERVSALTARLDGLIGDAPSGERNGNFIFGTGGSGGGALREHKRRDTGGGAPGLPDPRIVRATIRKRQMRAQFFDAELFADPAWDILLDLTAARAEGRRVSVTSLCIASGVPPTTALRWIRLMTDQGLLLREEDGVDRRRVFVGLTDKAVAAMARYFEAAGSANSTGI